MTTSLPPDQPDGASAAPPPPEAAADAATDGANGTAATSLAHEENIMVPPAPAINEATDKPDGPNEASLGMGAVGDGDMTPEGEGGEGPPKEVAADATTDGADVNPAATDIIAHEENTISPAINDATDIKPADPNEANTTTPQDIEEGQGGGDGAAGSTEPLRSSTDGSTVYETGPPTLSASSGTRSTVPTTADGSATLAESNGLVEGRPYSLNEIPGAHAIYPYGHEYARARELEDQAAAAAAVAGSSANVQTEGHGDVEVEAYTVPEVDPIIDDLHNQLGEARQQLEVAQSQLAVPVVDGVPLHENGAKKRKVAIGSVLILAAVAIIVGISVAQSGNNNNNNNNNGEASDTPDPETEPVTVKTFPPVLEDLKERGFLRCGIYERLGFSSVNEETGEREGIEIDICKAIAAASLGTSYSYETVPTTAVNRFTKLANGDFDVLISGTTHSYERDVHQASADMGFSFSTPYLYGGMTFNGVPEFVECADKLNAVGDCVDLLICVIPGTTWMDKTEELFPKANFVLIEEEGVEEQGAAIRSLAEGKCNVIEGEQYESPETVVRYYGYEGPYAMGKNSFTKEPLACVTRDGDLEFADFVNWVVQGLMHAEQQNITMETADTFTKTGAFGDQYEDMFRHALAAVGNYGEMYSRHLEPISPRLNVNMINEGDTGLLYSHPFGEVNTVGPGPIKGGVIEGILQRGFLRCGVPHYDSLNERVGLDIEFCRALSASILQRVPDDVSFERFPKISNDYRNVSLALENGEIDVYAGGEVDMNNDARYPLSFSKPYFYEEPTGDSTAGKAFSLVTKQSDAQWTDLVYWVVMATVDAEENGIKQTTSNQMPLINLFGPDLERILRDTILTVGNYGEMYSRVFGENSTRAGGNMLNVPPFGPQHYPLPFGNHLEGF